MTGLEFSSSEIFLGSIKYEQIKTKKKIENEGKTNNRKWYTCSGVCIGTTENEHLFHSINWHMIGNQTPVYYNKNRRLGLISS